MKVDVNIKILISNPVDFFFCGVLAYSASVGRVEDHRTAASLCPWQHIQTIEAKPISALAYTYQLTRYSILSQVMDLRIVCRAGVYR